MEEPQPSTAVLCIRGIRIHWRFIVMLIWPFISLLVFLAGTQVPIRCMYVVLVMAGYWICECLPLAITSFIPIAFFPMLGIVDTRDVAHAYLCNANVIYMCASFLAFAIQTTNLHRRLALHLVLIVGTTHVRLIFGFMFATMLVSFWMVNIAAVTMIAPIALAVLLELEENELFEMYSPTEDEEEEPHPSRITLAYFLGIAYAATIGGIGTYVGCATNLGYVGILHARFVNSTETQFAEWVACWSPMALLMTLLTWGGLCWFYLGLFRIKTAQDKDEARRADAIARNVIKLRLMELGKMTWAEVWVSVLFIIVVALWITNSYTWMAGWGEVISEKTVKNAVPIVMIAVLLFAIPGRPSLFYCLSKDPDKRPKKQEPGILTWEMVKSRMQWGMLFVLGAGFAISSGSYYSGMARIFYYGFKVFRVVPPWVMLFLVCLLASLLSEFIPGVITLNILSPVMSELAIALQVSPIYFMMPVAICCSWAFMLPLVPPNALVAAYAHIRTRDMMAAGLIPKLITLAVTVLLFPTYGSLIYRDMTETPSWGYV